MCFNIFSSTDFVTAPTLWVGTNLGSVLIVLLTISSTDDERYTQPVIVSPSGKISTLTMNSLILFKPAINFYCISMNS